MPFKKICIWLVFKEEISNETGCDLKSNTGLFFMIGGT